MRVVLTGAGGFIGTRLSRCLKLKGHHVTPVRHDEWDAAEGQFPVGLVEGAGAVIHLAGEPIAQRWTAAAKARIRESRIEGTSRLVSAIGQAERPPGVLICGSAIGYYGDRGEETLREDSGPGADFLAGVCQAWEDAASRAEQFGCRVVSIRTGMVLDGGGGALAKMLTPFRMGIGGRFGFGRQWISWIHLKDLVAIFEKVLEDGRVAGPVNATAPGVVRNAEFVRAVAAALRRPAIIPAPAFALRLVFGEMAEVLMASQRVLPARLMDAGFEFRYPELANALADLVGQRGPAKTPC